MVEAGSVISPSTDKSFDSVAFFSTSSSFISSVSVFTDLSSETSFDSSFSSSDTTSASKET